MTEQPQDSLENVHPVAADAAAPSPEYVKFDDFAKLDLRTAKVLEVREHPNADKLYLLQVQVGGEQKQIVAGVRAFFSPEDLVGQTVIIVNNLKPVTLRGEKSHGMMLAVRTDEGLTFLTTRHDVDSGLQVS